MLKPISSVEPIYGFFGAVCQKKLDMPYRLCYYGMLFLAQKGYCEQAFNFVGSSYRKPSVERPRMV